MSSRSHYIAVVFLCLAAFPVGAGDSAIRLVRISDTGPAVELGGEWLVNWGSLDDPLLLGTEATLSYVPVEVPSRWTRRSPAPFREGVATYLLVFELVTDAGGAGSPDLSSHLAFMLPPTDSAVRVFLNGEEVGGNGRVSADRAESIIEEYSPLVFPVTVTDGPNVLVVHVSNFGYPRGGFEEAPFLGLLPHLVEQSRRETAIDLFYFGVIAAMAIYHLIVFAYRPTDRSPLFLALTCIAVAVRLLVTGDAFLYRITDIGWSLGTRIEYLSWYLSLAPMVLFIDTTFRPHSLRSPVVALTTSSLLLAALSAVAPVGIYSRTIYVAAVLTAATSVYVLIVIFRAVAAGRGSAVYLLFGSVLFAAAVANDVVSAYGATGGGYLAPAGLTVFLMSEAFFLARRYADAFSEIHRLGARLAETNDLLEEKVSERTSRLERAYSEIKTLSERDPLTGAYNRRYLDDTLAKELLKSLRYGHPVSIVMGDLDDFKKVNDDYGHRVGDEILKQFVNLADGHVRDQIDWIARYGGEEFLIVLPETSTGGAAVFAERLRRSIDSAHFMCEGRSYHVTVSFGVATAVVETGAPPPDTDDLIARADRMLYRAKNKGKNRVEAEEEGQ